LHPAVLETQIVHEVPVDERSPRRIADEFRRRVDEGLRIKPAGSARRDPESLLSSGYTPRYRFEVFGVEFYLTNVRDDDNFRFFVAYVILPGDRRAWPRIFYKDSSLVWRSPTHYIRSESDNWIGKGDLKTGVVDGELMEYSAEETTNLPLEIQAPLDVLSRRASNIRGDRRAVDLILRRAPDGRFEPYEDFLAPRRNAMADPGNRIHGGRFIADFEREGDPSSLRFVPGFEPDFGRGLLERKSQMSRFYGGKVWKLRFLSKNGKIQYQFCATTDHAWIIPPQTLTTQLSSYAVRTVDVNAHEDLFVPGYEYHFIDETEDPPVLLSQIPKGYAGPANPVDPSRADASAWLEALPVIREFRRKVSLPD
jgi:hypothetical protein